MERVLVIDDDLMLSRVLKEHLTNEGYEVVSASMAEEGLEKARQFPPPDLIMLDVQLPDATGFQACGQLRNDPRTKSIPIIMMTGSARFPNQQAIGLRMGANEYILKPFNVLDVGDKVHSLLGHKPAARLPPPFIPTENTLGPRTVLGKTVADAASLQTSGRSFQPAKEQLTDPLLRKIKLALQQKDLPFVPDQVQLMPQPNPASESAKALAQTTLRQLAASIEPLPETLEPSVLRQIEAEKPAIVLSEPPQKPEVVRLEPPMSTPAVVLVPDLVPEASGTSETRLSTIPLVEVPVESPIVLADTLPRTRLSDEPIMKLDLPLSSPEEAPQLQPSTIDATALSDLSWKFIAAEDLRGRPLPTREKLEWSGLPISFEPKPILDCITPELFSSTMFLSHLLLTLMYSDMIPDSSSTVFHVAAMVSIGWTLFLGFLVTLSFAIRLPMGPRAAWRILGMTFIPIVVRSLLRLAGTFLPSITALRDLAISKPLLAASFWIRPLDVFEIIAVVILGYSLGQQSGSTLKKSTIGAVAFALLWVLTSRLYFRPF